MVVVGDRAMEIPTRLDDLITSYAGAIDNLASAMGPDVRTISLITPNGGEFYSPESLHTGEHSQKDMIDFCYSQMDDKIITVDAYSKLRSHTDEYIYFRTRPPLDAAGGHIMPTPPSAKPQALKPFRWSSSRRAATTPSSAPCTALPRDIRRARC